MKILNLSTTIHIRTLKVQWLSSFLILFVAFTTFSQDELSFLFVGDVMQHDGQIDAAYNPATSQEDNALDHTPMSSILPLNASQAE